MIGTESEHKLIFDYRLGQLRSSCSCGQWHRPALSLRVQRLHEVYDTVEAEHHRHIEEEHSSLEGGMPSVSLVATGRD